MILRSVGVGTPTVINREEVVTSLSIESVEFKKDALVSVFVGQLNEPGDINHGGVGVAAKVTAFRTGSIAVVSSTITRKSEGHKTHQQNCGKPREHGEREEKMCFARKIFLFISVVGGC